MYPATRKNKYKFDFKIANAQTILLRLYWARGAILKPYLIQILYPSTNILAFLLKQ